VTDWLYRPQSDSKKEKKEKTVFKILAACSINAFLYTSIIIIIIIVIIIIIKKIFTLGSIDPEG